jgi:predicted RNase H-like HicB family nuclease
MSNSQFSVYVEQDEDGMFIGSISSLPNCHAQGKTQKEMLKNLAEVATLCLRNHDIKSSQTRFIGIQNLDLAHA